MSTISRIVPIRRERNQSLDRGARVTHHFQDDEYALLGFRVGQDGYVFLYDADQRSLFLGRETQPVDLPAFWEKHMWAESSRVRQNLWPHLQTKDNM